MTTTLLNPACDDCYECDDCPVKWTLYDCRLYWVVLDPPVGDYTVTITGPGSYSETFENQPSGMIMTPATGTWIAAIVMGDDPAIECEIAVTGCEPTLPCCINTVSISGVFSGRVTATQQTTQGGGIHVWEITGFLFSDFTEANVAWVRALEMVADVKTDTNCYNSFGDERIKIGEAVTRQYVKVAADWKPAGTTEPTWTEAEVIDAYSYWLKTVTYDLFLVFDGSKVGVLSKITDSDVVNYFSTPPGPSNETIGFESYVIPLNDIVGRTHLIGQCGYESVGGGLAPMQEYWPNVSP